MALLKDTDLKYMEEGIKKLISSIENTFYNEILAYDRHEDEEEYPGYTKAWIKFRVMDLYYLIKAYLEARGMIVYLQDFHEKFDKLITDEDDKLLKSEMYHPETEVELKIITDFKRVLEPFKEFDYRHTRQEETTKLIGILKHTDYILKNAKAKVNSEADIYKQVKWVLGLYYPKCRSVKKASFIQEFKTYDPDILIPELKTAIEYKYVRDSSVNIDDYIDQVRTDSINYVDDYRYENFIAVLYIRDTSTATQDAIQSAWEQKKFPPNWELVIAMGSR